MSAATRHRRLLAAGMAAVLPLAFAAVVVAQVSGGAYELRFRALLGGGKSAGGSYEVQGVAGQPFVGSSTGGAYSVAGGLIVAGAEKYQRYTPLLAKDGTN